MYSMTNDIVNATLRTTLLLGLIASTSAFAGETTLASSERAARHAIADSTPSPVVQANDVATKLAHNEDAAQRVILNASSTTPARAGVAMGETSLSRNERAAQHSIADAPAVRTVDYGRTSAAVTSAASAGPAAAR